MSWFCIPCTYSPEQAAESSQTSCLDTLQSALSRSKNIPEEFCCNDNLTEFFRSFPFGTTLRRSVSITLKPQACSTNLERYQGNSPFVAGSRSCAKTFPQPEKEQASREAGQDFGLTWPALSARFDRDSSSWRIHPCLFPEDSKLSSVTLPRWGTCVTGVLSALTTPGHLTSGTESGLLPTPTAHNAKEGAYPAEYTRRTPTLASVAGGKLNPQWTGWLMGWPINWTSLEPLAMDKFQQWSNLHGKRS